MPYKDPEKNREYRRRRYTERKNGSMPRPPIRLGDTIVCSHCGKEFYRSPANRQRSINGQYCSRKCMAVAFNGRFVGDKSPRWKGRYTRSCDACGKTISRPYWDTTEKFIFCNTSCFGNWKSRNWTGEDNPCWRGGHPPYYGANWKRQQREARHRDNHQCQFCGVSESDLRRALDVHHIVPYRLFGNDHKHANALVNLVSLCEVCHKIAETFSKNGTIADWALLKSAMLTD